MRIETARLVIRSLEPSDAKPWLAMVTDPDVVRFVPPGPTPTLEIFQSALERRHLMERERGYAMWAVDLKETSAFVGQCGLYPAENTGPEIELAYHFNKASWNKGYATEAAVAVLAQAFGPVSLDRVIAFVMPENIGSCRVAEKAGMRFAGITTGYGVAGIKRYFAEREWWSPPHGFQT